MDKYNKKFFYVIVIYLTALWFFNGIVLTIPLKKQYR